MKKILVIDDDINFLKFVKASLEKKGGFEVAVCSEGRLGFDTARSVSPGLILLDVMMPDMEGPDVAAKLRADPQLKNIPLLFLTSAITEKEEQRLKDNRGWQYLSKPIDAAKLLEAVSVFFK